ncbi:MAG: TIGR01777 family oxidoreductase [Planctomycetota bacterium]
MTTQQKIAISGASGLVGTDLKSLLESRGHSVIPMTRRKSGGADVIVWDPSKGLADPSQLEGIDTVIHLAGENIAGARWNAAVKERIMSSRVEGTRSLVQSLSKVTNRPKTLICASAIGIYGHRGEELLTESAASGKGYLADVCRAWEAEAMAAQSLGMRVVCVRIGVVLSPKGGALAKMLMPFKLGLGGIVGNGKQYWSWIGLNDLVRAIAFCAENPSVSGPVNAVSPEPLTNDAFTRAVGKVLHRPTIFPLPAFMAKLVLGEMADELLLSSIRVVPSQLQRYGFQFEQPDLVSCLEHELK